MPILFLALCALVPVVGAVARWRHRRLSRERARLWRRFANRYGIEQGR